MHYLYVEARDERDVVALQQEPPQVLPRAVLRRHLHRVVHHHIHELVKAPDAALDAQVRLLEQPDGHERLLLQVLENEVDGREHGPLVLARHASVRWWRWSRCLGPCRHPCTSSISLHLRASPGIFTFFHPNTHCHPDAEAHCCVEPELTRLAPKKPPPTPTPVPQPCPQQP